MGNKVVWLVVLLLIIPAFAVSTLPVLNVQMIHTLPSSTTVWGANDSSISPSADLSALLPAQPVALQQYSFSSTGTYYVGAQAPTAICGSQCTYLTNSGVQTTIQVVSQQVSGCLSYWIDDDSATNIWGQVGYYICNGSAPVAFYQIWDLNTYAVLVSGTTSLSTGYHTFSMYSQSGGNVWAYALDGGIFGTYNMGASTSLGTYPVQALSEEGYVSVPWNPAQVQFSSAIQTFNSGAWSPTQTSAEYTGGCNSDGSVGGIGSYALYSCWGVQGSKQNSAIPLDALVVGGSAPLVVSGTTLWSGSASTSTSSASTASSTTSSTSSTPSSTTTSSTASSTSPSTTTTSSSSTTSTLANSSTTSTTSTYVPSTTTTTSTTSTYVPSTTTTSSSSTTSTLANSSTTSTTSSATTTTSNASSTMSTSSASSSSTSSSSSTTSTLSATTSPTSSSTTSTTTTSTAPTTTSSSSITSSFTSSSTSSTTQSGSPSQLNATITPTTTVRKSTVYFTVTVTDKNGNPVGGVGVSVSVRTPNGKTSTTTGTTDATGHAYFQYRVGNTAARGTYNVTAGVGGSRKTPPTVSVSGSFAVT